MILPRLKAESRKHLSVLTAVQNGTVWYSCDADVFCASRLVSWPTACLMCMTAASEHGLGAGGTGSWVPFGVSLALEHEVVWCPRLFYTIPWWPPASSSERSLCPGRKGGWAPDQYPCWATSAPLNAVSITQWGSPPYSQCLCAQLSPSLQSSLVLPIPCAPYALNCLVFLFSFPASPRFFFLWHLSLPLPFRLPVSSPSRHFRQKEFQDTACSYILY